MSTVACAAAPSGPREYESSILSSREEQDGSRVGRSVIGRARDRQQTGAHQRQLARDLLDAPRRRLADDDEILVAGGRPTFGGPRQVLAVSARGREQEEDRAGCGSATGAPEGVVGTTPSSLTFLAPRTARHQR